MRRRIGSGAFATVWLAYDEHLDSAVAIKVLADNWAGDHHIRQRFLEEGRFLRKVESPHVVTVYDAGELDDERPYLVMAYADQGTLADLIELSPLTRSQAVSVITQVGRGLTALHDRGVLHRDVKPANVLFRTVDHGRGAHIVAMLGDLGLGKAMDMSSRLTMAGGMAGRYRPVREIGRGGMGAVWLARDELLGREVALKRIGMAGGIGTVDLQRAEREARLAARLNHPHAFAVFDLVRDGDQHWLVMEHVPGTIGAAFIDTARYETPRNRLIAIAPIASSVSAAL